MDIVIELVIALGIGLLIGLERDVHARRKGEGPGFGVQIFAVIALLGFLVAYLPYRYASVVLVTAVLVIVFFAIQQIKDKTPGMTTSVALVTAFLLGGMSGTGYPLEAVLISFMVISILVVKEKTHRFAGILTHEELASALHFLALLLILLPLAYTLRDVHPLVGPGRLLDPVKTLLIVIFVSSFSFVSYIVIKTIGAAKGLELSSFLGGFVSSAASTVSLSRLSKINPVLKPVSTRGIILANLSMILKNVILITVIAGMIFLKNFTIPTIILVLASVVGILLTRSSKFTSKAEIDLGTPFAVIPAAKFGVLFVVMSVLSFYGRDMFGDYGIYAISLGGLISTTSVSASLAALYTTGEVELNTVIPTILFAMAFGSASKVAIAWTYDRILARKIALIQGAIVALCIIMAIFYI